MLDDVLADGVHTGRGLDQHRHLGGPLGQVVTIQLAQLIGHLGVGFVDGVLIDMQLHVHRLEVQRQRGLVPD